MGDGIFGLHRPKGKQQMIEGVYELFKYSQLSSLYIYVNFYGECDTGLSNICLHSTLPSSFQNVLRAIEYSMLWHLAYGSDLATRGGISSRRRINSGLCVFTLALGQLVKGPFQ